MNLKMFICRNINRMLPKKSNMLVFIPHAGLKSNAYGINNYKSDNTLAFLNYLLAHHGRKFQYRLAVDYAEFEEVQETLLNEYPTIDIDCFPLFGFNDLNFATRKKIRVRNILTVFFRASYFFTSEGYAFPYKVQRQKWAFLGYFIPFKNDYNVFIHGEPCYNQTYDYCFTTSLVASQIIAHTYSISLSKFYSLGFSRNDELTKVGNLEQARLDLAKYVNYPIKKLFLYTPTHRDYESEVHNSVRGVLGFNIDSDKLTDILKQYNAVIVCKIHSKQNFNVLSEQLPYGVVLHKPNKEYGLCELMQLSDCLITDYTSAYFDYLLLDKPVLFNFYDFDRYKKNRGFSYDPVSSVIAGHIFGDEPSFCDKIQKVLEGDDVFKEKRHFVCNLMHKYKDSNSSERIFNFIFKEDK